MHTSLARAIGAATCLLALSAAASAADLVATYQFNGKLAADQAGAPALTALNGGTFVTESDVFGQARVVYQRSGGADPSAQSVLQLDTSGLGLTGNSYAVQMVFRFDSGSTEGYRRLVDGWNVDNLQDNGFYVGLNGRLSIYSNNSAEGGPVLANGQFHDVVLNVTPTGEQAYANGAFAVSRTETPDAIQGSTLSFFLDNSGEYANGQVALIRVFSGSLTADEVVALHNSGNPFPAAVPEPSSVLLMLAGLAGLGGWAARRRSTPAT